MRGSPQLQCEERMCRCCPAGFRHLCPPPPACPTCHAQVAQLLAEASQRIQPSVGELFSALKVRDWDWVGSGLPTGLQAHSQAL